MYIIQNILKLMEPIYKVLGPTAISSNINLNIALAILPTTLVTYEGIINNGSGRIFIFYKAGYLAYNISNPSASRIQIGNFFRNGEDYIVGILGMYDINTGNITHVNGSGRILSVTTNTPVDLTLPSTKMFIYNTNYTYGTLTRNNTTIFIKQIFNKQRNKGIGLC
jgi:hypothetical protein